MLETEIISDSSISFTPRSFFSFCKATVCGIGARYFLGFEGSPESARNGGRQNLHGCKPDSKALFKDSEEETFFTILQDDKWYFAPEGVL